LDSTHNQVTSICVVNEKVFATAGTEGIIHLWNTNQYQKIDSLKAHKDSVTVLNKTLINGFPGYFLISCGMDC
jgi:WD40 repeat protein